MPSPNAERFHLGDILSVITGIMVSPGGIGGVHHLLTHMTGHVLYTHQLPHAMTRCAPHLQQQFPHLADIDIPAEFPEPREETVPAWLAQQVERFGEHHHVTPLAPDAGA